MVPPVGIGPTSRAPQARVLSIELRGHIINNNITKPENNQEIWHQSI